MPRNVVAQVEHEIEVVSFGNARVAVEKARVVLGARHGREPYVFGAGRREGPKAAGRRGLVACAELVPVVLVGLQAANVDLGCEVLLRTSDGLAGCDHLRHVRVRGNPPGEWLARTSVRGYPRPDDCSVGVRITARHAVFEEAHCGQVKGIQA